ncbi:hypothetical protein EZV73_00900 [Acidaminobacter sp. JC074]|uniref:hypothetical protein n=1 Tax=Acidaminobacter sp. JC074 TaxID=2530199 RepID=UPI001F10195A|nr:hypothetical protein [Acidaminobacter sp. JC074]MCH4886099.1 hypothetical protein [Acidaminobacter sp. JC074]
MRHEIKKICKIVDELTTLLLRDDTDEVDFKIKRSGKQTKIFITDYNTRYTQEAIEDLRMCFNVQRQHEVEEYYWQLVGECDCDSELTVIGAMIDSATVEIKDGNMYIVLTREA